MLNIDACGLVITALLPGCNMNSLYQIIEILLY